MSSAVATTGILIKRGASDMSIVKNITSNSIANPTVVTATAHGFSNGDTVLIQGVTGSIPSINGSFVISNVLTNSFTVPVNVTTGGTGGTATLMGALTTIAEIVNTTPPGYSRNKLETTTHNDGAESYVLGILRQKDGTFRINYLGSDATHAQIVADILANTKKAYQFLFPSNLRYDGPARIMKFEIVDAPPDAVQQADISMAWSGSVVMTAT